MLRIARDLQWRTARGAHARGVFDAHFLVVTGYTLLSYAKKPVYVLKFEEKCKRTSRMIYFYRISFNLTQLL